MQGAGGIGGLLCVIDNGVPYYPATDANGNITDYVDAGGTNVAHREFDPFGNTIVATGDKVNDFHFWFSSKYLDQETGMYYYGTRLYSPTLARWINRDPIEENGGWNLYGFVGNEPVGRWDMRGRLPSDSWHDFELGTMNASISDTGLWRGNETIVITFVSDPSKVCCSKIDFKQSFIPINLEGTGETEVQSWLPDSIPDFDPPIYSVNTMYKDPPQSDYYIQGGGSGGYVTETSSYMVDTPCGGEPAPDTGSWVKLPDASYRRIKIAYHFVTTATCIEGLDKGMELGTIEWELTYPSLQPESISHLVLRGFYDVGE
jgi:RHS repeat-associated protein